VHGTHGATLCCSTAGARASRRLYPPRPRAGAWCACTTRWPRRSARSVRPRPAARAGAPRASARPASWPSCVARRPRRRPRCGLHGPLHPPLLPGNKDAEHVVCTGALNTRSTVRLDVYSSRSVSRNACYAGCDARAWQGFLSACDHAWHVCWSTDRCTEEQQALLCVTSFQRADERLMPCSNCVPTC